MLVLQRKENQSFVIGDDIKVTILEINNDKVKIAIDAPKSIPIMRTELLAAADTNREAAASSQKSITELKNIFLKNNAPK